MGSIKNKRKKHNNPECEHQQIYTVMHTHCAGLFVRKSRFEELTCFTLSKKFEKKIVLFIIEYAKSGLPSFLHFELFSDCGKRTS